MIRKILVPVDGSAFAESAVPLALALADQAGAEIRLAMVNEPINLPPGVWAEAFLATHAKYLEAITESVESRRSSEGAVSSVLLEGEVASTLCDEATISEADLVVMSTHGHGGLTRLWLGSVADALLRDSPVPILLVRPLEEAETAPSEPPPVVMERIVVALDGSAFAEAALEPALELARLFGASVTLLKAVSYPVLISSYLPDTVQHNEAFIRQAEEEALEYLDGVRARYGDLSVPLSAEVLVSPRPAAGVLEHVQEAGDDLIAMASHARHGLARAVIGSIADKVVRGSHTPVLIVHPVDRGLHAHSQEVA